MKIQIHNMINVLPRGMVLLFLCAAMLMSSIAVQAKGANVLAVAFAAIEVSVVKRPLPIYPQYAIKNGIEGSVLVHFSIDTQGNPSDIEVVSSDRDGLFDATAILAVQKWAYTKPSQKIRNNYVAFEFGLTDKPKARQYAYVEKVQVRGK